MYGRIAAILLLACIPVSFFSWYGTAHRPGITIAPSIGKLTVTEVIDPAARRAGARAGDLVDASRLTVGDITRMTTSPFGRPYSVTLVRQGRHFAVPINDVVRAPNPANVAEAAIAQGIAIIGLILGAIVLWRRPSALAFAFGAYVIGSLYALSTAQLFEFLPDPIFTGVVILIVLLVGTIPSVALIPFALRFPGPMQSKTGKLATRAIEALLIGVCVLATVRTLRPDPLADFNNPWLDTAPAIFTTMLLVAVVLVRYARARGEQRRRLGWVATGTIVSSIGVVFANFEITGVLPPAPYWAEFVTTAIQAALPISFAYAILRHRVIDLGFAINRTVVYGAITASLVLAVSIVDWLSGKLIGNTHLSTFVEAVVTISLGVGLSWFHGKVERGVDRVFFRKRYVAQKRIEGRIAALGYATTTRSIDEALVDEVVHVLGAGSAAVFRRAEGDVFTRTAASGWDVAPEELPIDHLLVRTLRAEERTVDLQDAGIPTPSFPAGPSRPQVAIPIVVRHDFLGFALYGQRHDDAALDREDVTLLERLVAAAALAYDAVDAAEWRRRALAAGPLEPLPQLWAGN